MPDPDFCKDDLIDALHEVGVRSGDVVFSQSNIGFFGRGEGVRTADDLCNLVASAFFDTLGPSGTLVTPSFSYSFGSEQAEKRFDPERTPAPQCGMLAEYIRQSPRSVRSCDPMFSVSAIGGRALEMTENVGLECFGEQSFWRRFLDADGLVCNLNFDASSTFIHFIERRCNVVYRKNRIFEGVISCNNSEFVAKSVYFSRDLDQPDATVDARWFDDLARERGLARTAKVGRGAVVAIRAQDTASLIEEMLPIAPDFLTFAGARARETA